MLVANVLSLLLISMLETSPRTSEFPFGGPARREVALEV